jgi:hypothetical protein
MGVVVMLHPQKLYAMRDTATGYVKIGISKHPQV